MNAYSLIASLQDTLSSFDVVLRFLSTYGYSYHHLLLAGLIFWTGFTRIGGRLALGSLISTMLFGACRQLFASPRPYWVHPELFNGASEKGYGMPSGHTQSATVFWGLIARSLPLKRGVVSAILLITLTGLSRLYLGVHYPSQVLAGLIMGGCLLLLLIFLERPVISLLTPLSVWKKTTITVVASLLPLVIIITLGEVFAIGSGSGSNLPYHHLMRFNGLLTGVAVGLLFMTATMSHRSSPLKLFLTRAIPGAISVILFWNAVPELNQFKDTPTLYYISRYCIFFLLALWGALLWPLLHKHLLSRINSL